ncbi:MAG: hypothetical protein IT449_09070 [Phycisphaerales bacterium]|nr:hypothetical protein [Phycisphaerales bacterium]
MDDDFPRIADINDCGQVVFSRFENDRLLNTVYLYDNGRIIQLTVGEDSGSEPSINNRGQVAWARHLPDLEIEQVVMYERGAESVIHEAWAVSGIEINNVGHVSWSRYSDGGCPWDWDLDVMLWDGLQVKQMTPDDVYRDQSARLSDLDELVWLHLDPCANPYTSAPQGFWDGTIVDLPRFDSQDKVGDINNLRHVTLSSRHRLMLWRDGDVLEFVAQHGAGGELNDKDVAFSLVFDTARRIWSPWIFDLRNNRIRSYRIGDRRSHSSIAINEWGEAVATWINDPVNNDWGGGILLLRRIRNGDSQFDSKVDLRDLKKLNRCMVGPEPVDDLCECRFLDLDYDGDVDLADYSRFQREFKPE